MLDDSSFVRERWCPIHWLQESSITRNGNHLVVLFCGENNEDEPRFIHALDGRQFSTEFDAETIIGTGDVIGFPAGCS